MMQHISILHHTVAVSNHMSPCSVNFKIWPVFLFHCVWVLLHYTPIAEQWYLEQNFFFLNLVLFSKIWFVNSIQRRSQGGAKGANPWPQDKWNIWISGGFEAQRVLSPPPWKKCKPPGQIPDYHLVVTPLVLF